jgi:dTDP-4-dehydrorhamnose 3,5-epimerase-like enzyme
MNIEKFAFYDVRADDRGRFCGLVVGGQTWREINFFITKAGGRRGGHYATQSLELVFLLKGRVDVTLRDVRNPTDVVRLTLLPGEGVVVPTYVSRTFDYIEDGEAISCRDIPHAETGPDVPFEVAETRAA